MKSHGPKISGPKVSQKGFMEPHTQSGKLRILKKWHFFGVVLLARGETLKFDSSIVKKNCGAFKRILRNNLILAFLKILVFGKFRWYQE